MALLTKSDYDQVLSSLTARKPGGATNNVIAVVAPTGSGKSTLLPSNFINDGHSIFVVEPTISGARSLATFLGKTHQGQVGYAAEGEVNYVNRKIQAVRRTDGVESKAVYCTAGHMKNVLLAFLRRGGSDKDAAFATILMIDEAHIGSIEYDVVVYLWRYMIAKGWAVPRLILSSATYSVEASPIQPDAVVTIGTSPHSVQVLYHNKTYLPTDQKIYRDMAELVQTKHNAAPPGQRADTWLLFLPGSGEVEKVVGFLRTGLSKANNVEIVPAYSNVSPEEMEKIFLPVRPGIRRIVVATNVAETSLTLDSVTRVVDSMLEKVLLTSDMGGERLEIRHISQNSAEQRKGRTGRTTNGRCYRMMRAEDYAKLAKSRSHEIERAPIHSIILELLANKIRPSEVFGDKVTQRRLDDAIQLLKKLGCLVDSNGVLTVTPAGEFVASTPLSPRMGIFLWRWEQRGLPVSVGAAMAAMIDMFGPSYFFIKLPQGLEPAARREESASQLKEKFAIFNDGDQMTPLGVMIELWNVYIYKYKRYHVEKNRIAKFSETYQLNNRKFSEAVRVYRQLINLYIRRGKPVELGRFRRETTLPHVVSVLREIFDTVPLSNGKPPQGYFIADNYSMVTGIPDGVSELLLLITTQVDRRIQITLGEPLLTRPIAAPAVATPVTTSILSKPSKPKREGRIRFADDASPTVTATVEIAMPANSVIVPIDDEMQTEPLYAAPVTSALVWTAPAAANPYKGAVLDLSALFGKAATPVATPAVVPAVATPVPTASALPTTMLYADGTTVDTLDPDQTKYIWLPQRQVYGMYVPTEVLAGAVYVMEDGLRFHIQ